MVAGGRVGVRLPSMAMMSLVSRTDSLCRNCLVTSSSSLPRCRASCCPSLTIASRAAPCQPPKVSTAKGMKQMLSAAQRSSYLAIFKLKACLTPPSQSWATCSTRAPCRDCVTIAIRTFATPFFVTSATPLFVTSATPFFRTIATRTFATPQNLFLIFSNYFQIRISKN